MPLGDAFDRTMEAAREGEHAALAAIYRDLSPAVLGYLRGQRAGEPEDLASEVFVAVVRGLTAFQGDERSFRSWVFTIAHRRVVDERRRRSRGWEEPVDPGDFADSLAGSRIGDVEDEALGRLGASWAMKMLGRLTPEQREVVLLRVLGGLSVAEVAIVMGKAEGAIKALQRRALRALAREIERQGVS